MPRSGTTWLGKIFDSHPDTVYRHEPDSVTSMRGVPVLAEAAHYERYRPAVTEFATALAGIRVTKVTSTLPVFRKRYYTAAVFLQRRLSIFAAKLGSRVFGELPVPDAIGQRELAGFPMVWKSVESVGRLGVLCRILPEGSCVLILRHPCGYIASVLRGEAAGRFGGSTRADEDYGIYEGLVKTDQARRRGLTLARLRRMAPVERLAWRWMLFNEKAMDDIDGLPGCAVVRYEDVCRDPQKQARLLFEFSGLGWNDQTERFVRRSTARDRSAYYSVIKDPRKSAHKWREELDVAEIEQILSVVKDSRPGMLYCEVD